MIRRHSVCTVDPYDIEDNASGEFVYFSDIEPLLRQVKRYQWLRENPAFETEMVLSGLSPDEFDAIVDKRRGE